MRVQLALSVLDSRRGVRRALPLINMLPVARISDFHVCPMINVLVPHVGGPILPPSAVRVLSGGLPTARVGDLAFCVGPPDVIVTGSPKVLVMGRPVARITDKTIHGGMIVAGLPRVLIGGATGAQVQAPTVHRAFFQKLKEWTLKKLEAAVDLKEKTASLKAEITSFKGRKVNLPGVGEITLGASQVSAGLEGDKAGAFGSFEGVSKEKKGTVLGSKRLGITAGVKVKALAAEGFIGSQKGTVGATAGATLGSVEGSLGANVAGYNASAVAEAGLKWELGFKIGPETVVRAGPFSLGLKFGKIDPDDG